MNGLIRLVVHRCRIHGGLTREDVHIDKRRKGINYYRCKQCRRKKDEHSSTKKYQRTTRLRP